MPNTTSGDNDSVLCPLVIATCLFHAGNQLDDALMKNQQYVTPFRSPELFYKKRSGSKPTSEELAHLVIVNCLKMELIRASATAKLAN